MTHAQELKNAKRAARELKTSLVKLTTSVVEVLAVVDRLMKEPESSTRGSKLAKAMSHLDLANDCALHFALGMSFEKIRRFKRAAETGASK